MGGEGPVADRRSPPRPEASRPSRGVLVTHQIPPRLAHAGSWGTDVDR